MITKITGQTPFQVLTNNFSISPSNEGYTLQISADGVNFSNLFSVGANVTRLVTGVAANSYYRLLGNESAVQINWMKTCVTEGGSGGSGTTYSAGTYIDITEDVISVTGITPDLYLTSADTENFLTSADTQNLVSSAQVQTQIDASVSGKADAANVTARNSDIPSNGPVYIPKWNEEGIITGDGSTFYRQPFYVNGVANTKIYKHNSQTIPPIYAPVSAGTAGDVLVSLGNGGAPIWITPATINGSAITSGGNIEIQAGVTSADVKTQIEAYNYMDSTDAQVISTALVDLDDRVKTISAATPTVDLSGYYTSAQTEQAITSKNYITSAQAETQITNKNYVTSAQVETQITGNNYASSADVTTLVNSAFSYTNEIERVTASAYTELHDGLMEVSGRPVFNAAAYYTSAETEQAITGKNYVTSGQVETQITGKHYTTSSNQSVVDIVKIEQSDYDTLVAQSATSQTTLYVVVPDSI